MPTFRVFGRKYQDYYTMVSAANEYEAIDVANSRPATDWDSVETDDVIEAVDVYLDDDDIQLNIDNDDWPTMDPGIIVGD